MLICDSLNEAKDLALNEKNPHIFTIATLTGHAMNTYGKNYSVNTDIILKDFSIKGIFSFYSNGENKKTNTCPKNVANICLFLDSLFEMGLMKVSKTSLFLSRFLA